MARLKDDHLNAKKLARALQQIPAVRIAPQHVETNIVIFEVPEHPLSPADIVAQLKQQGVLIHAIGGRSFRAVTHMNIAAKQIDDAAEIFSRVLG